MLNNNIQNDIIEILFLTYTCKSLSTGGSLSLSVNIMPIPPCVSLLNPLVLFDWRK